MMDYESVVLKKSLTRFIDSIQKPEQINIESFLNLNELKGFKNDDPQRTLLCLTRINDIRYINKFLIKLNDSINRGDSVIGYFETFTARRKRLFINKIPVIGKIYFLTEFLFKRLVPKIRYLNKIYFAVTKGKNRLLSKAEVLGRLVYCGFEIKEVESINGMVFFHAGKTQEPLDVNPSYSLLIKLPRIGKNGKSIGVYKFRTMHPYSEFLQDYVLAKYGYAETGKLKNDFRLTPWGKVMRRYWIDELPQIINLLKGEMKLVGIRPTSESYFQRIPMELQLLRTRLTPGCIPPYVSLNYKSDVESVLSAEKIYLTEKAENPIFTDTKYLFLAIYNILIRRKRSA